MKKFILFLIGLVALLVLIANLGPMILLGLGIWLLYIIFKKFMKSTSTGGKIGWVMLGLIVLSVTISNIYAVLGIVAAYGLYVIIKNWNEDEKHSPDPAKNHDDPFTNFERQWEELKDF